MTTHHDRSTTLGLGVRCRTLLGRFRRDDRGVHALEFGLLALPFFGLLFAIVEVSWVSFNSEQLQAAVNQAARQVMTGQVQGNNVKTSADFANKLLCPTDGTRLIPNSWNCSNLFVDVRTAADFTKADMTNTFYTSPLQYCLGNPATIVVLRVVYPLASVFPLSIYNRYIGLANNVPNVSGWQHILMGSAVFKTEHYSGSSPTC
jgi:Flp pilus assembly protein TadG